MLGHVHVEEKSDTESHTHACEHTNVAKAVNFARNQKLYLKAESEAVLNSIGTMLAYKVEECGFICIVFS